MRSKIIIASLILAMTCCGVPASNVNGYEAVSAQPETSDLLKKGTYFQIEESVLKAGSEFYAVFHSPLKIKSLSILDQSPGIKAEIFNKNDEKVVCFYTSASERNYSISFYSKELPPQDGKPVELASLFIFSDGSYECASSLSADDAKTRYFLEFVASDKERECLGYDLLKQNHFIYSAQGTNAYNTYYPSEYLDETLTHYNDFVYGESEDSYADVALFPNEGYSNSNFLFSARVRWSDENGKLHPLKNSTLIVKTTFGITFSAQGASTDRAGEYKQTLSAWNLLNIKKEGLVLLIKAETPDVTVYRGYQNPYEISFSLKDDFPNFKDVDLDKYMAITFDVVIYPGRSDRANAFEVSQALNVPHEFFTTYKNYQYKGKVEVIYPFPYTALEYYAAANTSIGYTDYILVRRDDYNNWDVLTNEYSRHLLSEYGMFGNSQSVSLSYANFYYHQQSGKNLARHGLEWGLRTAFIEGVTTFLAMVSQMAVEGHSNIPGVGDYIYFDSINCANENYDKYGFDSPDCVGDAVIGSVTSVLIKIYDNTNRPGDNVSLTDRDVIDLLFNRPYEFYNGYNYLGDLISTISDPTSKENIAKILELEGLSPTIETERFYMQTYVTQDAWTFSWSIQNASIDAYELVFVGSNNQSYTISNIRTNSVTLTVEQVNEVYRLPGVEVSYYVAGYHSLVPSAGRYCSPSKTLHKNYEVIGCCSRDYASITAPERYVWYKMIAPCDAYYVFETKGQYDTVGEIANHMLADEDCEDIIDGDDDSGVGNNFRYVYQMIARQAIYIRIKEYYNSNANFWFETSYYQRYSQSQHIYKDCYGNTTYESHISDGNTFVYGGKTYTRCKHCGQLIDMTTGGPILSY